MNVLRKYGPVPEVVIQRPCCEQFRVGTETCVYIQREAAFSCNLAGLCHDLQIYLDGQKALQRRKE